MTAYAGLGRRSGAAIIDLFVLMILTAIVVAIIDPGAVGSNPSSAEEGRASNITGFVLIAYAAYFVIAEWRLGKTIGKAMCGITVVQASGDRITLPHSLGRNFARLGDVVLGWFLIPTSATRQRLGDRMVNSVVLIDGVPAPTAGTDVIPAPPLSVPPPSDPAEAAAGSPPISATWGPLRVLAGLGGMLGVTFVGAVIAAAFDPDLETLAAALAVQLVLVMALIGAAFVAAAPEGRRAAAASLGLAKSRINPLWPTVGAYLGYFACAIIISALLSPHQEDVARDLGYGDSTFGDIAAAALIIVGAPLSEEIFFRGFMFAGIRSKAPFAVAATVSAAVWGLFHYTGPDSWPVILQLTVFGVILAWLYERTGSIRPTIAVHLFNNAIAFILITSS